MKYWVATLLFLAGCAPRHEAPNQDTLVSVQIVDRNGFSETTSSKDRLDRYEAVDFVAPQPYQKVLRIFGRDEESKGHSKITAYHPNGQISHYLEVVGGRAHGWFREWHPNGQLKIESYVLDGVPDITDVATLTWLFEGHNKVWDEAGNLIAEIRYQQGVLEGPSLYYYPSGALLRDEPYERGELHGFLRVYGEAGEVVEETPYRQGIEEGVASAFWQGGKPKYTETYEGGKLRSGVYTDREGAKIAEVVGGLGVKALFEGDRIASTIEVRDGSPCGAVKVYSAKGAVLSMHTVRDGKKEGEELFYFEGTTQPRLSLPWRGDHLEGVTKTWYPDGTVESQREIHKGKKHGLAFAWYRDGGLMLMEEYDQDKLIKGSYYKKWEKDPTSRVEGGAGTAMLYDGEGHFVTRVTYEKGTPQVEL